MITPVRIALTPARIQRIKTAAESADWRQVVANGGPPCFHLFGERFCLRAERWEGHGALDHPFVSLGDFVVELTGRRPGPLESPPPA